MSFVQSSDEARGGAVDRPACMTPGCSVNCSHGYSCHERRLGRVSAAPWPVLAVAALAIATLIV